MVDPTAFQTAVAAALPVLFIPAVLDARYTSNARAEDETADTTEADEHPTAPANIRPSKQRNQRQGRQHSRKASDNKRTGQPRLIQEDDQSSVGLVPAPRSSRGVSRAVALLLYVVVLLVGETSALSALLDPGGHVKVKEQISIYCVILGIGFVIGPIADAQISVLARGNRKVRTAMQLLLASVIVVPIVFLLRIVH